MNSRNKIIRPKLLTWLCIGSGTFGIMWVIMLLAIMIFNHNGNIPSGLFPGIAVDYMNAGYVFMIAEIVLLLFGLIGVIMMWHLRKSGFYLYASMKVITYFLPVIFIGSNHLTYPGLIITSIFIVLYGVVSSANGKNDPINK
jgi:hypothetical protein